MKKILSTILCGTVSVVFLAGSALAAGTNDPVVQKRMENQEKRIDQGVQSGQLTPKEAGKLETQQTKIKQEEARMKSDGKLTKKERAKLKKDQDKASKKIYKKKHNEKKADVGTQPVAAPAK